MSETIEPDKKTYEELLAEIDKLKNKCDELTKENNKLISKINNLRDIQGYEISGFFFDCNSLKITAEKYFYNDIVECGYDLIEFQGCTDVIQCADDYKEYCRLEYDEDSDNNIESGDKDNVCENNDDS
jgi:hypothetical protein